MPERVWQDRIADIIEAVQSIRNYASTISEETLTDNTMVLHAILFNFTVIGEAARHVPETIKDLHPEIPWVEMRSMRNIVAHVYWGISRSILWQTITTDLPPLLPLLENILEENEEE